MIYFATILILLGLFFFIVASLDLQFTKKKIPNLAFVPNSDVLFNIKYPSKKNTREKDERISVERKVDKKFTKETEINLTMPSLDEIEEEDQFFTKPKITIINNRKQIEPVVFKAVLFFDYSNKIAIYKKQPTNILPVQFFQQLKRVGVAQIQKEENSFLLESTMGTIEYKLADIEDLFFFEEAFGLHPKKKYLPTPILFSNEIQKIKGQLSLNRN
jgi:hypothetical protein